MAIKYKWLAERLESLIQKNIQNGINKLPTEQELCSRYHVSRQTVRMALAVLQQKGLIEKKQGSGSHITGRSSQYQENIVDVLISSNQDYIYPTVLNDIRNTLSEKGFSQQVFVTANQVCKEREILLQLSENPPRGLIVEGCKSALPNPNLDLYYQIIKKGCQIVFLYNNYPALHDCITIKDDNLYGSALLVRHLAEMGHLHIGGIFKSDDLQGIERYQGYIETLRILGIPLQDEHVCWFASWELDGLLRAKDARFLNNMLKYALSSCTAVICYNDLIAYYLIDELLQAGYQLPDDMAVAAFDNSYFSNSDILTVTTLSHRPHEMGKTVAEAVIKKLSGLPVSSQEIRWELNLKESTSVQTARI